VLASGHSASRKTSVECHCKTLRSRYCKIAGVAQSNYFLDFFLELDFLAAFFVERLTAAFFDVRVFDAFEAFAGLAFFVDFLVDFLAACFVVPFLAGADFFAGAFLLRFAAGFVDEFAINS
jgi:hypothetical protein